ncbi:MAG: amidohydrolase family protein [Dehalococcoidaceae bacterium]|nr:amidohydrolase family protein [Dehalococcoidaceae bacterium]
MIVDAHTHIFPPEFIECRESLLADPCFRELYSNPQAKMATAEQLVSSMDENGIGVSIAAAIGWSSHELCRQHNDYLAQAVKQHPDRIIGLGMVQPRQTGHAIKEIERMAESGLRGVGEFRPDLQGIDLMDSTVMQPVMQVLDEHGMVLMLHSSEPGGHIYPGKGNLTPETLLPFIERYAQNRFILAHWGGGIPFYELQPEIKKICRNVYYDTAATPYLYEGRIYHLAAQLTGENKILFGSDYPLLSQGRALKHLGEAGLAGGIREQFLAGNTCRLFGIHPEDV